MAGGGTRARTVSVSYSLACLSASASACRSVKLMVSPTSKALGLAWVRRAVGLCRRGQGTEEWGAWPHNAAAGLPQRKYFPKMWTIALRMHNKHIWCCLGFWGPQLDPGHYAPSELDTNWELGTTP